jgi:glycosyltransferase involved in cell wall biosynthesis
MATELSKHCEVEIFTFVNKKDWPWKMHVGTAPTDVDLVIINHHTCMKVLGPFLECPKVYTQHGPHHSMEIYSGGADIVVAVSEEISACLKARGFHPKIITNGVDLSVFHPYPPTYDVLNLCKGTRGSRMVSNACESLGLSCMTVHYKKSPTDDVASYMKECRMVVSCGRGAIEGLACGKKVLIYDAQENPRPRGDDWVTEQNVDNLATVNFSGRYEGIRYDIHCLKALLNAPKGFDSRGWAEENADIREKADDYFAFKLQGI